MKSNGFPKQELVLKAVNLGKSYKIFPNPKSRFKSLFFESTAHKSHASLTKVSFELYRGQCMGVIGNNGAGKSTLLKLLAGTLHPSEGTLERQGRVTAILELGSGFHPDFSGRENLLFAGNLIGIGNAQMKTLEQEIIEFAELQDAIDRPVKTYSSGMVVRLAFALVTALEPDLLIVDEALAVGDQNFQKKCMARITAFRERGCSILFCSHSLYHVRHLCDRAIWLDNGKIAAIGETEAVIHAYEMHLRQNDEIVEALEAKEQQVEAVNLDRALRVADGVIGRIESMDVMGLSGDTPPLLQSQDLTITVTAQVGSGETPNIAVMLEQSRGVGITSVATHLENVKAKNIGNNRWQVRLVFPDFPLHSGDYVLSAYLFDASGMIEYDKWYQHKEFRWIYPSKIPGLVRLPHYWE